MTTVPTINLRDRRTIPQLGFGIWQVPNDDAPKVVGEAFKVGYRAIDGAQAYENEQGLGKAIAESGLSREEIFITTKLWNDSQGYDNALKAFDESLSKLGLDYVDLYLIHWPSPHRDLYEESWKALIKLKQEGRAKSIGVSNFHADHLTRIIDATGEVPTVNQIELHPKFQQKALREFHAKHNIATESWSPLGQGKLLEDATITAIGEKYGKTPAQVILRWHLDNDLIVIPKSVTPSRIASNFEVFDFKLDADDKSKLDAMDDPAGRVGPDPDTATF